jgi:hypothetical protein
LAFGTSVILAAGCGGSSSSGGGGGGDGSHSVLGIPLPQEISALPPKAQVSSNLTRGMIMSIGSALTSPPADSDYANAVTVKYVNEQALSQFDILNSIFKSVGQTHYADAENVGQGPYAAMVTAVGGPNDSQQKTLQLWTIDSSMETEDGHDVNVIHVWMTETDDGHTKDIRVVMKVFAPPTQNADGSYSDYGVWTLNAELGEGGSAYFAASAEQNPDGGSIVKIHELDRPGQEVKGVLHKSGSSGFGKVSVPDQSQCHSDDCSPPTITVAYVYDAHHVKLTEGGNTMFKDRDTTIDLVERYAVFDAVTGADVTKAHHFGFPISYDLGGGVSGYGYYGAFQGQHQIWANGSSIAADVQVARADLRPGDAPQTYTTSAVYPGTLVKRTLAPGDLDDIAGVAVQTWDFHQIMVLGNGSDWQACDGMLDYNFQPPHCTASGGFHSVDYAQLTSDDSTGRQVFINGCIPNGMSCDPVMAVADPIGLRFQNQNGGATIAPDQGVQLNVNVNAQLFIAYDSVSAGFVQKAVASMDPQTHQPTFLDDSHDTPYTMPADREFYLNNMGVNYVVSYDGSAYHAQIELDTVANPDNVDEFIPASTSFAQQWGDDPSTFTFDTDPSSGTFLQLLWDHVGAQDQSAGTHGQPVTAGQYGLVASVGGTPLDTQFNWNYPQGDQNFGSQQFLKDGDGAFVILEDPLRFTGVSLNNGAGESRNFSLQFDGQWMGGLPDVHMDLQNAHFNVTDDIKNKNVSVPNGTELVDATGSGAHYLVKQLQVSEYLATLDSDPGDLDLSGADALDLSTVPAYSAAGMTTKPTGVTLKYSEGNPVQ